MITLHRLGHAVEPFQLNPDMIVTIEANPDTTITLTTGAKIVVAEPPEKITSDMQRHRVEVLARALERRHELNAQEGGPTARRASPSRLSAANTATLHLASIDPDTA